MEFEIQKLCEFLKEAGLEKVTRCSFSDVDKEAIQVLAHRCFWLPEIQLFFDPATSEKLVETKVIQQKWDVKIEKNNKKVCVQIVKFGKLFKQLFDLEEFF